MNSQELKLILDLIGKIGEYEPLTPEQVEEYARQRAAQARERSRRRNARFAAALSAATDVQSARIDAIESDGYRTVKLWTSRRTGRICVMLQKDQVFDIQTSRIRTKLAMVYPDGRHQYAFNKITIHNDWL